MIKLTFLILALPLFASSTCIVIAKTDSSILVAADSKRTIEMITNGEIKNKFQSICKIGNYKNRFYAIAGSDDKFLHKFAMESLFRYSTIDSSIIYFIDVVKYRYKFFTEKLRKEHQEGFNYYKQNALASVCFFGINNKSPYLIVIDFQMELKGEEISITTKTNRTMRVVTLGFSDHINALDDREYKKNILDKRGLIYRLENMVKLEIKNHNDSVGGPIDLLELIGKKVNWIRRKEKCEDLL